MSLRELETFLKWLQEAETTVNVLADASQREDLSQDTAHVKELRRQLEVGAVEKSTFACTSLIGGRVGLRSCIVCRSEFCECYGTRRLCHCLSALNVAHWSSWPVLLNNSLHAVCASERVFASTNHLVITQISLQKYIDAHLLIFYVMF